MASRKTSRGWARLLVAVPEVISTCLSRRSFGFRQRTQNFPTARPAICAGKWARPSPGRLKPASASLLCTKTRRATSMTVTSWRALTRPMPVSRRKSVSFHLTSAANEPASAMGPWAMVMRLCPRLPLRSSMASNSVSLSAAAPSFSRRSCGRSLTARSFTGKGGQCCSSLMGRGAFARWPASCDSEVLHVGVASELLKPALSCLAGTLLDECTLDVGADFVDRQHAGMLAVLGKEDEGALGHDKGLAALALLEGKDDIAKFLAEVGAALPAPVAALALARVLAVFAGEVAEIGAGGQLNHDLRDLGTQGIIRVFRCAGNLDQTQMHAVLLIEGVLVLLVERLDLDRADGAGGLGLLLAHVLVNHVLLLLLAVIPLGDAAGAQVGEELAAVAVELGNDGLGDLVINVAGGHLALLVLVEILHDQDAVDEVLDDILLQGLEFFVEFLLVAAGFLDLGDQRADFPADVVHRDDPVLGNGSDAVGVAQVKIVRGRRGQLAANGGQGRKKAGGGEQFQGWWAGTSETHLAGRFCRKVMISFNLARGVGAVKRGKRLLNWMKSSRRPELRRHFSRLPSDSTDKTPLCSARARISVTKSSARTSSPNFPKRSRSSVSRSLTCLGFSAIANRRQKSMRSRVSPLYDDGGPASALAISP